MKNQEKQQVKKCGLLSMFVLIAACCLLIAPVWNDRSSANQEKTLRRAESLAYQVLEGRKNAQNRGPASENGPVNHLTQEQGEIGLDPWGHTYRFKLLNVKDMNFKKILVWSAGPNGRVETQDEVIESNQDSRSPRFEGDDLGIMLLVK